MFAVLILWLKRVAYQVASDQVYIIASGMLEIDASYEGKMGSSWLLVSFPFDFNDNFYAAC